MNSITKYSIIFFFLISHCLPSSSQKAMKESEQSDSVQIYDSMAEYYAEISDYEKAQEYALKACSYYEDKKLGNHYSYISALRKLSIYFILDQDLSVSYLIKASDIIEKYYGINNPEYMENLMDFAGNYKIAGKPEKALQYVLKAKEIGETINIKKDDAFSYFYILEYLSEIYSDLKRNDEAILYAEESLNFAKEEKEISIEDRLPVLDSLVVYHWNISNVEKANLYAKEAYLVRKSLNITGQELVANLFYLVHSNYHLKKYEECVKNVKEIQALVSR